MATHPNKAGKTDPKKSPSGKPSKTPVYEDQDNSGNGSPLPRQAADAHSPDRHRSDDPNARLNEDQGDLSI